MGSVIQEEVENLIRDAKHIIDVSRKRLLTGLPPSDKTPLTFQEKLMDIYFREYANSDCKAIRSDPLRKFTSKNLINCLVINLYRDRKVFNLAIKTGSIVRHETELSPYDENELSSYIDSRELPPHWAVQALQLDSEFQLFYCGGIVTEICYHGHKDIVIGSFFIHMKISSEARFAILEHQAKNNMSREELCQLESQMVMESAGPLCLDPSPTVCIISNHLQYEKLFASRTCLKKLIKHNLPAKKARRKELEQLETSPNLESVRTIVNLKPLSDCHSEISSLESVDSAPLGSSFATPDFDLESLKDSICQSTSGKSNSDDENEQEKYVIDLLSDKEPNKVIQSGVVTVTRNPEDLSYHGQLSINCESDAKSKNVSRSFPLGSKDAADKYVNQFVEVFTNTGCKPCTIQQHKGKIRPTKMEYTGCADKLMVAEQSSSLPAASSAIAKPSFMMENILSK